MIKGIVSFVKKFFSLFLDVSGSLLGIFLIALGIWMKGGWPLPGYIVWILVIVGIAALAIHLSHYLISRKHGSEYFYTTRK